MAPLKLVKGRFGCPRHPSVQVKLNIPGLPFCAHCGKPLRRLDKPSTQSSLFKIPQPKKETSRAVQP